MRSQLAEPLGVQTPQIVHNPPGVVSLAAAEEAIELADAYGVCRGFGLDEAQQFTMRTALGERSDGTWAATTVGDFEARQNGKNDTCAARELAGLILFGELLQLHTAHEFKTANESFLRLVAVFENHDALRKRVARIRYANGEQGIELLSGQRLKYSARTGGAGRGFAEADLVVYDEAQHLHAEHVAASGPSRLANPNSQAWYMGSGGLSTSEIAWRMRRRALSGDGGRFAYVEHTAETVSLIDGKVISTRPEVLDRDAWALANAAYGRRITDEALLGLFEELGPELFARECLCLWDPELGSGAERIIPPEAWLACEDPKSGPVGRVAFALDVSPDRRTGSFGVVGESGRGGTHGEIADYGTGTAWMVARAKELQDRWSASLAVAAGSPAASLLLELEQAGVKVTQVTTAQHAAACGALFDEIVQHQFKHLGQHELNDAVDGADRRFYGDSWLWSRRTSVADISPLVAVTLAKWAYDQGPAFSDPALSVW